MTPKRKLKQTTNYEEKSNGSYLSSSKKRNKKTENALTSIIMILTDMFNIIFTCNVRWVQIAFTMVDHLSNMDE